jgi:pimeloyl-ACP methyl ester carboxylesterase
METRKYGTEPYVLVLVHGGPAAAGYMAPLAEKLSGITGVIEAFQSRATIPGLIQELRDTISEHATRPVILLGHSWGAWLSVLYSARYPEDTKKLILVSSPPFEEAYAKEIQKTRMERLDADGRKRLNSLNHKLRHPGTLNRDAVFLEIAGLIRQADAFRIHKISRPVTTFSFSKYNAIWSEALPLRASGELLHKASMLSTPVVALHGDYDPHPWMGVSDPLEKNLEEFHFQLLENCGHEPWNEKFASEDFYRILEKEIRSSQTGQCNR